jgi:alginate O-acetyltransferase complex protein AlgI
MDAPTFLGSPERADPPGRAEWIAASVKIGLETALFWGAARLLPESLPLLRGWVGCAGLILLLHFGLFHLLALAWQHRGVPACHIMRAPLRSTAPSEFWGKRWNLAFRDLAAGLVLKPVSRRLGPRTALMGAFLASGGIHELVISLPAGAGYGLPAGYFLLQGLAVSVEKSSAGRRWHLNHGWRGWIFTAAVVAGPAFWLFHPPFINRVVLPFLNKVGAL